MTPSEKISAAIRDAASGTAIVAFVTAGYPKREEFRAQLTRIGNAADVVEIGVPFTDPMADEKLASAAVKSGVSGFIIPDLPYDEGEDLRAALAPHGLALIQMVTPVTRPERLAKLCAASQGFVYAVTMTGTTGRSASVPGEVTRYLDGVTALSKLPVCAGFGIRGREQVEQLKGHVAGVIVGSALVEVLESGQDAAAFLQALRPT